MLIVKSNRKLTAALAWSLSIEGFKYCECLIGPRIGFVYLFNSFAYEDAKMWGKYIA